MPELSETMRFFTGLTAVTVIFLVAGTALIACNRTVDRKARNVFTSCLATLACIALADWFMYLVSGQMPQLRMLHAVLMAITFAVAPFLPVFVANTICPNGRAKWMTALLIAHAVFELVGIVGGYVFYIDESNVYHRASLYPAYMAVYTISAMYLIAKTFIAARAYQSAQIATVFGILLCMFTGVIIQVFDSSVRTTWPAVSMAVVLYFLFYSDMVLRTDALTMLLNRRSYEDALAHPTFPCVAVVIDIDDFKAINDTYGHAYGDECLERAARMIRQAFGQAGLCYRTGGDEFAVIMTKRLSSVEELIDKLMQEAEAARNKDERMPTLSAGFARAQDGANDINELFERADQMMYSSKRESKS